MIIQIARVKSVSFFFFTNLIDLLKLDSDSIATHLAIRKTNIINKGYYYIKTEVELLLR